DHHRSVRPQSVSRQDRCRAGPVASRWKGHQPSDAFDRRSRRRPAAPDVVCGRVSGGIRDEQTPEGWSLLVPHHLRAGVVLYLLYLFNIQNKKHNNINMLSFHPQARMELCLVAVVGRKRSKKGKARRANTKPQYLPPRWSRGTWTTP